MMDATGGAKSGLARLTISHYAILERLGEGGMGVVFKARDSRLDRLVALKTLRAESVDNSDHRLRLIQEAKSASALNHPNIVHIYEAGSEDGVDFIAMEYVTGVSLAHIVKSRGLPWEATLRYAVQIADALDAAHGGGILHRDLKPSNVMITERGLVKVLDFGLAKPMAEHKSGHGTNDEETITVLPPKTTIGSIVGTPGYMSPEQVTGDTLDARSDIFALGVMLYQMVTGELPFKGASNAHVQAAILRDEPAPPHMACPQLPPEAERIILRCLRKDKAKRFQNMLDVKLALEDLIASPSGTATAALSTAGFLAPAPVRPHLWLFAALGLVAAAGLGLAAWERFHGPSAAAENNLTRLTNDGGLSTEPAISPDGKLLAYSSDRSGEGKMDIWVQQVGGGEPIRLTHDPVNATQPDFSPDSTLIVFHSDRERGGIYLISALGGTERKIADKGYAPHFSPDAKRLVWWEGPLSERTGKIYVMDLSSGSAQEVKTGLPFAGSPIWSEDGKYLLFRGRRISGEAAGWWIERADGENALAVTQPPGSKEKLESWHPSAWRRGRVIFSVESAHAQAAGSVFSVALSPGDGRIKGPRHRLTPGITTDDYPSLSAEASSGNTSLVFASLATTESIYSEPIAANDAKILGSPERLTRAAGGDQFPSVSADGNRIAFQSTRSGEPRIWMKDLVTGREMTVGKGPLDMPPFLSPDGSLVAWSDQDMMAEPFLGGPLRRICGQCGTITGWSSDGKSILYSNYSSHSFVGVRDIASGQTTIISHPALSVFPRSFSPDGHWIAAVSENPGRLMIVPFRPGQPVGESEWVFVTDGANLDRWPEWSQDSKLLYFTSDRDGFICIWAQRLAVKTKVPVGPAFPVAHFHGAARMRPVADRISLSRNKLVFSLEERSGNIWMTKADLR